MKTRQIATGALALMALALTASVVVLAVSPPVYRCTVFTIFDGSSGFLVFGKHQAYAVNTHPQAASRVDLIGDWSIKGNAVSIKSIKKEIKSMAGHKHWNRIDWTIELDDSRPPLELTERRVFAPWSVIAMSGLVNTHDNQ